MSDFGDWRIVHSVGGASVEAVRGGHAHELIAKIPHSHRWRVTKHGRIAMSAALQLRDVQFPIFHLKAAA